VAHRTAVILVVALSEETLAHTPRLRALGEVRVLRPPLPAVTCTAQADMLTGEPASVHGIVGNGWYDRESAEVRFWKQSNRLVRAEKVWETARRREAGLTCANLCWWFNMYSGVDYAVTPRPMYFADGRKIPDCWTRPATLRDELQGELGRFPLFRFWGPGASIESSEWIAGAARIVETRSEPTLSLVYLPHLDYALQRDGPESGRAREACAEIDHVAGDLIEFYRERGVRTMVVSEYGIEPVDTPIYLNRVLREPGLLGLREELGREQLDAGASRAFALADHQVAHIYVRDAPDLSRVTELLRATPGVARVLDADAKRETGLDHERAGDLVAVAAPGAWFAYPFWLDDARAPDYARTVDIHRKAGYDPAELFIDPRLAFPKLALARRLLMRRLGFRTLLDVIPLDASLVRGSHGRDLDRPRRPVLLTEPGRTGAGEEVPAAGVRDVILGHLFG